MCHAVLLVRGMSGSAMSVLYWVMFFAYRKFRMLQVA